MREGLALVLTAVEAVLVVFEIVVPVVVAGEVRVVGVVEL